MSKISNRSSTSFVLVMSLVFEVFPLGGTFSQPIFRTRCISFTKDVPHLLEYVDPSGKFSCYSTDTTVATVRSRFVTGKKFGKTLLIAQGGIPILIDTCHVTVVPWVAGVSTLTMENLTYPPSYKSTNWINASVIGDTVFLFDSKYWYTSRTNPLQPMDVGEYPPEIHGDIDNEPFLHTDFGYFILGTRDSLQGHRRILKTDFGFKAAHVVCDSFPQHDGTFTVSSVLAQGWDSDDSGNVYLGEYNTDDQAAPHISIKIYKGTENGEHWHAVYAFPPRDSTGYNGGVRHVHAVQRDPYTGDIWIATGDGDAQSRIYYHTHRLEPDSDGVVRLNLVGTGSQETRTVSFAFTEHYIYWFMDAPYSPQKIFRIGRRSSYPTMTPMTTGAEDYKEVLGTFADKPFYFNVILHSDSGNMIIANTVDERNQMEIDTLARLFAIKEAQDGSYQVQEIASFPAARDGRAEPVGTDLAGNIYLLESGIWPYGNAFCVGSLKWNDFDSVDVAAGNDLNLICPNTGLTVACDSRASSELFVYGSSFSEKNFPMGIQSNYPFEWIVYSPQNMVSNLFLGLPVQKLTGLTFQRFLSVVVQGLHR